MHYSDAEAGFAASGGLFVSPMLQMAQKAKDVNTLIFDWDGVFHEGQKDSAGSSRFSEVDSMGVNMLRFGLFLQNGVLPFTAILTGENNPTAQAFAKREHFDLMVYQAKDKKSVFERLAISENLHAQQAAFFFDDILDLGLAREVGVRFYLLRKANPMLNQYVFQHKMADYASGSSGGQHGLRECCEVMLAAMKQFQATLEHRAQMSPVYLDYWEQRNQRETKIVSANDL
jgi:3-deoxy-D-manno-octulosonate 8-phosphate phosphatase (KDO 8-P phosphatase)